MEQWIVMVTFYINGTEHRWAVGRFSSEQVCQEWFPKMQQWLDKEGMEGQQWIGRCHRATDYPNMTYLED